MRYVIEAARRVAREVEQSINQASPIDIEVKSLLAASWLTFAEGVEHRVHEENMAALRDEAARPLRSEAP